MKSLTLKNISRSFMISALVVISAFSMMNIARADTVRVGPVVYYQGPPEPAPCSKKVWVPEHRYKGYFVPGQYVTYSCDAVREKVVYIPGHYYRGYYVPGHYRHVYYRY